MRLWLAPMLVACGGSSPEPTEVRPSAVVEVSAELLNQSWQVAYASPDAMGQMASQASWGAYFKKDYEAALGAFDKGSRGLGRMHAELANAYRQAALLQANAIEETYGEGQLREGDPVETDYLLGVASWVLGDKDSAVTQIQGVLSSTTGVENLKQSAQGWSADSLSTPEWMGMTEATAGTLPSLPANPHYQLPEQGGERLVEASDPALSLNLARWHEEAALQADPGAAGWMNPWRLPGEAQANALVAGSEDLFLGPWMTAGDVALVSALSASTDGSVELAAFQDSSILATLLVSCLSESVDPECVVDQAAGLQTQLMGAMEAAAGPSADHAMLASLGRVGVLRAGVRLAHHHGDEQSEGLLRVSSLDASTGPSLDPVFQISMAAWDTGNRNSQRAQDLLHAQRFSVPGIDSIRISLNALSLRVSRDAGDGIPMH